MAPPGSDIGSWSAAVSIMERKGCVRVSDSQTLNVWLLNAPRGFDICSLIALVSIQERYG